MIGTSFLVASEARATSLHNAVLLVAYSKAKCMRYLAALHSPGQRQE
jgi:hypothetical protein